MSTREVSEYSVRDRLEPIMLLADEYGLLIDSERIYSAESSALEHYVSHDVVPTIGCEVEIKWSALFPEIAKDFFGEPDRHGRYPFRFESLPEDRKELLNEFCASQDEIWIPKYKFTEEIGIPKGNDAYWEFANSPAYSHQTLSTELDILIEAGLIPADKEHSLHVTLGDLATKGGGVHLMLANLEMMYANPARIEMAVLGNRYRGSNTWARRGNDGVRSRHPAELKLGSSSASEIRTLSMGEHADHKEILRSSQLHGAILKAYRSRLETQDSVIDELSILWQRLRGLAREAILSTDLPLRSWGKPHLNKDKWLRWAEYISSRHDEGSHCSDIITDIHELEILAEGIISQQ